MEDSSQLMVHSSRRRSRRGSLFAVCCLLFAVAFATEPGKIRNSNPEIRNEEGIRYSSASNFQHLISNFQPLTSNLQPPISDSTDSVFTLIKTIPLDAKDIQTDRLGNMYVVSKTNQLYKYSQDGKLLSTLNYKYLGNITQVDATNPLEIYVFYKELNLVVFLDNNLAYRGEMRLTDLGIGQAAAVARSFDNGLWAFDLADLQLKKIDKDGGNLQASGNVRQYIEREGAVTYLYDNDDRVFVNDSINGILVFDVFATYLKTIPVKGCNEIKVIQNELFYQQNGMLFKYQLKTFTTQQWRLPEVESIRDISIEKNRLFLLKTGEIRIYGF